MSSEAKKPFVLGPYWKPAAAVLLAVYLSSCVVNSVVYTYLSTNSDAVVLGRHQAKEVAEQLKMAEEQLKYDEIMGYIPTMSEEEFDQKLWEIGSEIEEEQKVSIAVPPPNPQIPGPCHTPFTHITQLNAFRPPNTWLPTRRSSYPYTHRSL